ncbi:Sister chromatid cohesion 1 protein 2 [Sesamum alatum]|uniref:Sister chromatid cohesion 1 protein 2 n=1 Tax=Sesamum alatum TaxID=300844 RepID=A0AAE2CD97_9LAMI|nr:Sister chromatid cohesion 1 protein 2 [Sesamum alatum]
MFYSQLLLSKKGALGIVWMAAHCHKRLKKHQVQQTDISSSVDKILNDEVPVVTHRILAFLLLGVVRIYSKKVEYLYNDCHEVLNTLYGSKTGKSARGGVGVSLRRYHSITLPKRFELDAFDLEDQGLVSGNVRSHKKVMHAGILLVLLLPSLYEVSFGIICALYYWPDGHRGDGSACDVLYKENMPFSEANSTAHTPPRDVLSPHRMDQDLFGSQSSDMNITLGGPGILRRTSYSLEDRLDPMVLDEAEEEQMHNNPSNNNPRSNSEGPINELVPDSVAYLPNHRSHPVPSLEILRGTSFCLEDRLEPMVLDEAEKDQTNDRPPDDSIRANFQGQIQDVEFDPVANPSPQGSDSVASLGITRKSGSTLEYTPSFKMLRETDKGHGHDEPSDEEHMEHPRTVLNFQEDEPHNLTGSIDKEQPVGAEKVKFLEVITPESGKWQRTEEVPIPIVTPDPKLPAAHLGTSEVTNVQTPGTKERKRILKKRKTLVDSNTIVPNKVFKNWLEDPSDLKRERRKVPHTCLHAWRTGKLGHCPQSFFEPLISGISIDFGSLECKTSCTATIKPVDLSAGQDDVKSPVTHEVHQQISDVRSPVAQMSPEPIAIAPGTPVTHLNSLRSHEPSAVADSDIVEQTTSFESTEKFPSSSEGVELDAVLREDSNSLDAGDSLEKDAYSSRTRMTENYLSRKFQDKRRQNNDDVLNLSQLLEGKTKKQSARLFYDILVLKSRGSIDVQQENSYDDILVRETSKQ